MTARVGLIWAEARGGVIGARGGMPWHVPEDLARFKSTTVGAPVVMGRRTWESFPERFRPLPGRRNIVVTRQEDWADAGAERAASLEAALTAARETDPEWIWVIGGGQLYRAAIALADRLDVTELDLDVDGDTRAPERTGWRTVSADPADGWHTSRTGIRYRFLVQERDT
ncbi:dihydrofolate reductase [Microbacterium sp. CPCC 204701]|uniref:dihydrofolate reductase n=1 Tax=Microbacterium sp. CPCC 204701 TaxID=2493084 RepID=UPI000FD6E13F|nr:dihydrofolate reductase [Microbacterium sp. CPCC 204701]